MTDESSPLDTLAGESSWVEIDPPEDDDDSHVIGYFRGDPIRVSEEVDGNPDEMNELHSGPYEITLIDDTDGCMIFVDRTRVEAQNRQSPTGRLTAYGNQITLTLPNQVVGAMDIQPGDRFWATLEATDGEAILRFADDGPHQVTVSESFNSDSMEHENEIRLGKAVGAAVDVDDGEHLCDWRIGETAFRVDTGVELPEPELNAEDIRKRDPSKVGFEAGDESHYTLAIDDEHPVAATLQHLRGLSFRLATYNDTTALKAVPNKKPVRADFSRQIDADGDEIEVSIPEEIGDLLRLYDRSWIRLYWLDGALYGIPTETYGPAPILP